MSEEMQKATARSKGEMDNIMRKVKDLELVQNKLAKQKQEALETLVDLQERFEQKEQELLSCLHTFEKVNESLKAKKAKRDALRDQVNKCNADMSNIVKATIKNSLRANYHVKELDGNYHAAERAAERGFSAARTTNKSQGADLTQPMRRTFGATNSGTLNGAHSMTAGDKTALPSAFSR